MPVAVGLISFCALYALFAVLDAWTRVLRCRHPVADLRRRCSGVCTWCDYVQSWAQQPKNSGPYRTADRTYQHVEATCDTHS